MFRRFRPQDFADPVIDRRIGLVVLAEHFEIDAQRRPAHAEVRLPLQLGAAAAHVERYIGAILVGKRDGALGSIHILHRHIEHAARDRRDRQEGRVCRLTFRTQRRQHDAHDGVELFQRADQHVIELARRVIAGGAGEFIVETERVEEAPQHRVVVVAIALKRAVRVRHHGQRLVQMRQQERAVRHILRNLAHAVHVVGETQEPGRDIAQQFESPPHHRGPRHFAEGADMRQARRPIAGLEQHFLFPRALDPRHQLPRLLERPGLGRLCGIAKGVIGGHGK